MYIGTTYQVLASGCQSTLSWASSRDPFLSVGVPTMSLDRVKLDTINLVCRLSSTSDT